MSAVTPSDARASIVPTIHVVSDSVGLTGQAVARAAASQFGETNPRVEVLSKVHDFEDIRRYLEGNSKNSGDDDMRMLVFYTLVDQTIKEDLQEYALHHPSLIAVDLMSDAVEAIASFAQLTPSTKPGGLHVADQNYYRRIEAMEFTIAHDDGRNPQDLPLADIVLVGVSRSSKTPLSIYLAQESYRVANVPLDLYTEPPEELFDVDPTRLFGLMTVPKTLITIRQRRLGNALSVASDYADPEKVRLDLEKARAFMRKLGCIVIHTENRAVEETAQEVLRYYELVHPRK